MQRGLQADVAAVKGMAAIPTILDVVCRTTGMGFAAVARVTEGRWIACSVLDSIAFGLVPGAELKVETTICDEIRSHRQPVVINHVSQDAAYCNHPTPAMYQFESYISMPIVLPDGSFFGTLCAIDPKPHRLDTPEIIGMFRLFAELIALQIEACRKLDASQASLHLEREDSNLREQFIAVLGHDLRNPLAAVTAGLELIARKPEQAAAVAGQMRRAVKRMSGLIDNVLDFAQGRLGGGLAVSLGPAPLEPILNQVIEELRIAAPSRVFTTEMSIGGPVTCDQARLAQLFSNLLGNAITHGAPGEPIHIRACRTGPDVEVAVTNAGPPIPPETMARLFQPFFRGGDRPSQQGLGLGLYIACEIAKAHGGTLSVKSTPSQTRFTLHMPAHG